MLSLDGVIGVGKVGKNFGTSLAGARGAESPGGGAETFFDRTEWFGDRFGSALRVDILLLARQPRGGRARMRRGGHETLAGARSNVHHTAGLGRS